MVKCVFCGKEEHSFKGIHVIGNDGEIRYYCSSKCRKNALNLKRDKRKLKWTLAHKEERAKTAAKEVKKAEEQKKPDSDKKR